MKTSKVSRFSSLALLIAPLVSSACGGDAPTSSDTLSLQGRYTDSDPVIATVGGRAVHASDLQREARAPEPPRAVLDRLIDAEVLTAEAERRGWHRDPDVVEATRQARVQRLLREFEATTEKSAIPERELATAYNARLRYFVHPDMAQVWHILVPSRNATLADHAARRAVADQVQKRAAQIGSLDDFKAIAKELQQPDGAPLVLEEVIADPQGVDKTFVKASLALARPGDISPVVETEFGFHVIYLARRLPAQSLTLEQATPELRDKLALDFRTRRFATWMAERMREHVIERHDEHLPASPASKAGPK